ncbi:unnamed protein product [Amoebophrya sp. A120]|nr:unnamed protein product [Amoebophrya sp. A120]|eukprot:GSA120T00022741001.1
MQDSIRARIPEVVEAVQPVAEASGALPGALSRVFFRPGTVELQHLQHGRRTRKGSQLRPRSRRMPQSLGVQSRRRIPLRCLSPQAQNSGRRQNLLRHKYHTPHKRSRRSRQRLDNFFAQLR